MNKQKRKKAKIMGKKQGHEKILEPPQIKNVVKFEAYREDGDFYMRIKLNISPKTRQLVMLEIQETLYTDICSYWAVEAYADYVATPGSPFSQAQRNEIFVKGMVGETLQSIGNCLIEYFKENPEFGFKEFKEKLEAQVEKDIYGG